MICKTCGREFNKLYTKNQCNSCYVYEKNGGTENEIPKKGEIKYDSRNYPICHICGRAYKKIGAHLQQHNMTISEYRERFGINQRTALTNSTYHNKMKELAYKYGMQEKIVEAGKNTRIKKGEKLRLNKKARLEAILNKKTKRGE